MNRRVVLLSTLTALLLPVVALAQQEDSILQAQAAINRGHAALRTRQNPDGGWQDANDPPAITAIALRAFVHGGKYDTNNDFIQKGYDKLLSYQLENGGIYQDLLANYNTAIAVSALAAADDERFKPRIERAVAYLKGLQWTENTGGAGPKGERVTDENNPWYGGWGYGRHGRPDGSNMQLALDALHDAGLEPGDPAYQAALKFVSRMQNQSETNDQPWASDDGGFVYTPANNGESQAGAFESPEGDRRLRSYGSMTYAGLKSMIYAGLTKDDPRVRAAWDWITRNWTLGENPGMRLGDASQAQHGLYYYYHTLARALNAYDQPTITDPGGNVHDWRLELIAKLSSLQQPDGTWVGDKRWMEDNPVLVTSYAVLALQEAVEDLKQHPVK